MDEEPGAGIAISTCRAAIGDDLLIALAVVLVQ
jgi:hypothetical protein